MSSEFKITTATLENCLFGAVFVTKNGSEKFNKFTYSGYGIGYRNKKYLHKDSGIDAYDLIIFGANLSDSSHAENKRK